MLTDEQIADVLMVGYGYHRGLDWYMREPCWIKGWLPGAPTNPLNVESEIDSDEE
jgi:hypothetical protein